MGFYSFVWNIEQNAANRKRFHVSMDGAKALFFDKRARIIKNPERGKKDGFVIIGKNPSLNMILVCEYRHRAPLTIEFLAVRRATASEAEWYIHGGRKNA